LNWDSDQIISVPASESTHHNSTSFVSGSGVPLLPVRGGAEWGCVDVELGACAWAVGPVSACAGDFECDGLYRQLTMVGWISQLSSFLPESTVWGVKP